MASPKKENNHKPKVVPNTKSATPTKVPADPNQVNPILWVLLGLATIILFFSVFKNISNSLFWADESMTVVGGQRVLEFGYPKVHDGKNVFYDLRHTNPRLGIDEKTDAYIGGSNWGHYYFAALGIQLANVSEDIYTKTGIIRSFFALLGLLGIFLLGLAGANYLETKPNKIILFIVLFLLSSISVGLILHIREVRYYPLVIFLFGTSFYLFSEYAIRQKAKFLFYAPLLFMSLFALFMTFSPAFFIFYLTIGLWTIAKYGLESLTERSPFDFIKITKQIGLISTPFVLALILAFPLLSFFKTFEINEELVKFNGYNDKMYWDNFSNLWKYFTGLSLIYIAIPLKIGIGILYPKLKLEKPNQSLFQFSLLITLFFICYIYMICRVPNYLFTRYFVEIDPLLFLSIILDAYLIGQVIFAKNSSTKLIVLGLTFGLAIVLQITKNGSLLNKRYYELTHKYEGPLDAVVNYIKTNYKDPKSLVIATNYEETSYMYYLGSKVTIGFIGNNLEEDKKILPDIIQYRKSWGTDPSIFSSFLQQGKYERVGFPIRDNFTNNCPEVIFPNPMLNHQFKTLQSLSEQDAVEIFVRMK